MAWSRRPAPAVRQTPGTCGAAGARGRLARADCFPPFRQKARSGWGTGDTIKEEMPAKPKLGQNFLNDTQAIERIASSFGDLTGRTVVEIGPGGGRDHRSTGGAGRACAGG